ncbi:sugar transferase [Sediminibacterium sp.]|uniref:sugar transferase n=1 Tax=Sediminibacterium sp. TaxID=1917865 RepID=UPI003F6F9DF1
MGNIYSNFFKFFFDFIAAFTLLLILSPILLLIILLLIVSNNGNVFFVQTRPGLNSKPFKIIKFKTMVDSFDNEGNPLPDEMRITKFGRFIRSTSLDETLQLINVLRGDMSLVGPRPLLMQYLERYSPEQNKRHLVKPGITGWAQVNGRNAISWEQKFKLDVFYVNNLSFYLDFKILIMTIKNILLRKNINQSDNITMKEFMGND